MSIWHPGNVEPKVEDGISVAFVDNGRMYLATRIGSEWKSAYGYDRWEIGRAHV